MQGVDAEECVRICCWRSGCRARSRAGPPRRATRPRRPSTTDQDVRCPSLPPLGRTVEVRVPLGGTPSTDLSLASAPRINPPGAAPAAGSGRSAVAGSKSSDGRVHAVAQAGRARAVVEDVAEVRAARAAVDLDRGASRSAVLLRRDAPVLDHVVEARPARAGLELRARVEQRRRRTRRSGTCRRRGGPSTCR